MALRIEDYAIIGDCETAALVGRDGSIDWLCWPRFDSDACFAALLGSPDNGRWRIAPVFPEGTAPQVSVVRRYRGHSLVLETRFETPDGAVCLVDFMPPRDAAADIVRMVVGERGRVPMRTELILRFGYGQRVPWVSRLPDNSLRAIAGPDQVVMRSDVELRGQGPTTVGDFIVSAGETYSFTLGHAPSHLEPPPALDARAALQATEAFWSEWASRARLAESCQTAEVMRSLITLKALTYAPTGGIVAAPTTSLPETLGGTRNWDYRFCWLRDATLSLLALMNAGYFEEAAAWRNWLLRAAAGSPSDMQIMYGIGGERRLSEWTVDWLPGYEGAKPVRVGNLAADQLQLDVYGELMDAFYQAYKGGVSNSADAWAVQRKLLELLSTIWHNPDRGIWESRGEPRHYTFSKVMAWVAFDRGIKFVEEAGLEGPVDEWRATAARIHADVCENGYDAELGSFVEAYGNKKLDGSLLLMPTTGFLPPTDPRIIGTVRAVQARLMVDGFVMRHDPSEVANGLAHGEGAFLACTFWLADALVLLGEKEAGREIFDRVVALANDVGLLSEAYEVRAGRLVGNFPQAFSHIALVNTAHNLDHGVRPAEQRAASAAGTTGAKRANLGG